MSSLPSTGDDYEPLIDTLYCRVPYLPQDVLAKVHTNFSTASEPKFDRYEHFGQRFLSGHAPFLLTAALRGPFDLASGWQNPWDNPRTIEAACPQSITTTKQQPTPCRITDTQAATVCPSPASPCSKMQSSASIYLPSPVSLQADTHPFLDRDELIRVEKWRDVVKSNVPKKDDFWITQSQSSTKRQGEDISWLRRRSDKKPRTSYPDSNSTANAASIAEKEPTKPVEAESDTSSATTSSSEDDLIPNRVPQIAIAPVKGSMSAQPRKHQWAGSAPVAPLPQSTSRITRRRSSQDSSNPMRRISLSQQPGQVSTNLTSLRMSQPVSQSQPPMRRLSIHRRFSLSKDKPVLERPLDDTSSATDSSDESEDPIATLNTEERPRSSQQSMSITKSDLRYGPLPTESPPMDAQPMEADESCSELTESGQSAGDGGVHISIPAKDIQMKDDILPIPAEHIQTEHNDITIHVKADMPAEDDKIFNLHESDSAEGSSDSSSFDASGIVDVSTTLVEDESKSILCTSKIHLKEGGSPTDDSVISAKQKDKEEPELQSPSLQDNNVESSSLRSSPPSQTSRTGDVRSLTQTPDRRVELKDQSPWMEEPDQPVVEETTREEGPSCSEGAVARATPELPETRAEQSQSIIIPEEAQSPWTKDPSQRAGANNELVVEHSSPQLPETAPQDVLGEAKSDTGDSVPNPPSDISNAKFSIRSFSSFMTPPAKPRFANVPSFDGRLPQTPTILDAALENPWQSNSHPKKRVSWAPLPHEETPGAGEPNPPSSSHSRFSRASPPPSEPIPDEVEGDGEAFRRHFVQVKRRADPLRQRLLPSASQLIQGSPRTDAMAQAFVAADHVVPHVGQLKGDKENVEQEPVDDVDAVLGNLNEFLDTWDLDADLERSRTSLGSHEPGATANRMLLDPEIGGW